MSDQQIISGNTYGTGVAGTTIYTGGNLPYHSNFEKLAQDLADLVKQKLDLTESGKDEADKVQADLAILVQEDLDEAVDASDAVCCAQSARRSLLNLWDEEAAAGNSEAASALSDMIDQMSSYIQGYVGQAQDEEEQERTAANTYAYEAGEVTETELATKEAYLSATERRKHATIVRTHVDGSKEYKFPIPDKAHAKAALSRLDQSDLSAAEKAKVKRRAYRMLGKSESTKEADDQGMIGDVMESFEIDLKEADFKLGKNELTVTFLQPGFNRSGARYYKKEAISEAVAKGLFSNVKMFVNHATSQELNQRPERDLKDWVSTIKESWVDPQTGAGKARVKVVQPWFAGFLKDLKENDALGDVGLSIFARGRTVPTTMEGRRTAVVEEFQAAMSVDWVTEPGAGGRVDEIWESYTPVRTRTEELNVLSSMSASEALAEIKKERGDVLALLQAEVVQESTAQAEAEAKVTELQEAAETAKTEAQTLKESLAAKETELVKLREGIMIVEQEGFIRQALGEVGLPDVTKNRIIAMVNAELRVRDGKLDHEAVKEALQKQIKEEQEYATAISKALGGKGIQGLGESSATAAIDNKPVESSSKRAGVISRLEERFTALSGVPASEKKDA